MVQSMSIGIIAQDLVDRVKAITEFSGRVGLAVGGQEHDPINRELTRPAAWVIYVGDDLEDAAMNPCVEFIKVNFIVKVLVDYDDEATLVSTHFPLLHNVVREVRGNEPVPGSPWLYEGQVLEALDSDRMVWAQNYSVKIGI